MASFASPTGVESALQETRKISLASKKHARAEKNLPGIILEARITKLLSKAKPQTMHQTAPGGAGDETWGFNSNILYVQHGVRADFKVTYVKDTAAPDTAGERAGDDEEAGSAFGGSSGDEGPEELGECKPWLTLTRGGLSIDDVGNAVFKQEPGTVGIVAVMGQLRTGKSTLVNALAERPGYFKTSSGAASFTKGVEVSDVLELGGHKAVFADMEGQRDKSRAYDVKLATPLLLTAKAVVLNVVCPTGPSKVDILETLHIAMKAAEQVSDDEQREDMFGYLHVVLRGCKNTTEECCEIIFGTESEDDADATGAKERNTIRSAIRIAFEGEPRVWCVPDAGRKFKYADAQYSAAVDGLRATLIENLSEPKRLDGMPLTGTIISKLVPSLKEALDSDAVALNPPSMMEAVFEADCSRVKDEMLGAAKEQLASFDDNLPMDATQLETDVKAIKGRLHATLCGRVKAYPATCKKKVHVSFEETFEALAKGLEARNRQALAEQAKEEERVARLEAEEAAEAEREHRRLAEENLARERREREAREEELCQQAARARREHEAREEELRQQVARAQQERARAEERSVQERRLREAREEEGRQEMARVERVSSSGGGGGRSGGGSRMGTVLKKDGTPDRRYVTQRPLTKSGKPDMRYKVNKRK